MKKKLYTKNEKGKYEEYIGDITKMTKNEVV